MGRITGQVSIGELERIASELINASQGKKIWLVSGEMGAGKTTLIKAIGKVLGVKEQMASPTFSIVNEYAGTDGRIYHFDFYRLKNEGEAYDIGVDEYFDSGNYCFIEWPEKVSSLLPGSHFKVNLLMNDAVTRTIEYAIHD